MSRTQGRRMTADDDGQLLPWDLACASGVLSEIATTWRRAQAQRPDLPLGLPQRLADTALRLATDALFPAVAAQGGAPDPEVPLTGQMSALREGIASARALTDGPGASGVGDAGLWEFLGTGCFRA